MTDVAPLPIEIPAWLIRDKDHPIGNEQHIYRFDNGYGASVIRGPYTYGGEDGLYELGVIVFEGDDWGLTYGTPITEDVLGHLTVTDLAALLVRIAALPASVSA